MVASSRRPSNMSLTVGAWDSGIFGTPPTSASPDLSVTLPFPLEEYGQTLAQYSALVIPGLILQQADPHQISASCHNVSVFVAHGEEMSVFPPCLSHTTHFANCPGAHFDIPNVRNDTLTLLDNREASFFFNITNYSCIKHGNFRVKMAKIRDDNYQATQCVLRHEDFICQNSATQGSCVCTDHAGTYRFTRTVDRSDSVKWRFWVTSSLVNGVEIEEDVEEGYVVFSVVSPRTTTSTTPSSPKPTRPATVTPQTHGESGPENGEGNTTGKRELPQSTLTTIDKETTLSLTDTDSITQITAVHGDDDVNLMLIYIIVGVVASTIAVTVIVSSVICAVKACRAKHPSPLRKDYELRHPVTLVLEDGRQSHQEVTRLRPLCNETQTQQPSEGAVFQNQLYQNLYVFLVQPSHNDNDDYLVPVVR